MLGKLPLTWRLVLLSAVSLLCVTIISTLVARNVMQTEFERVRDRELMLMTDHVIADLADIQDLPDDGMASAGPPRFSEIFSGAYWVFSLNGTDTLPELRSRSVWDGQFAPVMIPPGPDGLGFTTGPVGEQLRIWRGPALVGSRQGTVTVGINTADHLATQERVGWLFTTALVIEGLLALAVAAIAAVVSLKSIRRFTGDLQALRAGEIDQIDEDLSSEIAIAAQEVNALKAAQSRLITRAREQAGALAHSLKTPLAVIIQSAEKSDNAEASEIRKQADAALTHVHHHLAMARSAAPLALQQATELRPVVDGIVRVLEGRASDRGVRIVVHVGDGLALPVEEADLHDIVGNLVENAVRHAKSIVEVAAEIAHGKPQMTIQDDGPGLDDEAKEAVLHRGYSTSSGDAMGGLGLSITRDLIESYDGRFVLQDAPRGGLKITIQFLS